MREDRRDVSEDDLHLPADEVGDRRRGALVGDVHHVDTRHHLEKLGAHVRGAAVAVGRVREPLALGERDQLLDVRSPHRRMHREHRLVHDQADDRSEILDEIPLEVLGEAVVDRLRRGGDEQGVPVRGRACDGLRADVAAGAGAVLDNHVLAEKLGHLRREQPHHHVGAAAGGERHDHAHRAVGKRLREGIAGDEDDCNERGKNPHRASQDGKNFW